MSNLVAVHNSGKRTLKIDWDPGNTCNYKCWYCFPDSNTGTVPWPEKSSVIQRNLAFLIMTYLASNKIDNVRLTILGGEPTLWPELGTVVQYLKDVVPVHITVLTNGSRTLRWWEKYAVYFDHVSISVHHESADIDHLKALTKVLDKKGVFYHTQVLMDHTAWDKCVDIVNQLTQTTNKFLVTAKAISINGVSHYTNEQQEYLARGYHRLPSIRKLYRYFKELKRIPTITAVYNNKKIKTKNEDYFVIHNENKYKGWSCNLGVNRVFINRKGQITGTCEQLLYGLDYYYNINDRYFVDNFYPNIEPVVCSKLSCMCAGETIVEKKQI